MIETIDLELRVKRRAEEKKEKKKGEKEEG